MYVGTITRMQDRMEGACMRIACHEDALVVIAMAAEDAAPCARAGVQLRDDCGQQHRHAQQRVKEYKQSDSLKSYQHPKDLLCLELIYAEHVRC